MKIYDAVKVTSKGQITLPAKMRKILHLEKNQLVSFRLAAGGILVFPVEIKEKSPYTKEELKKLEKLASQKGEIFRSAEEAKEYLDSL